jgi:Cna protein B-type domain.
VTTYYQIQGQVTDADGVAIANVSITYDAPESPTKAVSTVKTDSNGYYNITNLVAGSYNILFVPPTVTANNVTTVNYMVGQYKGLILNDTTTIQVAATTISSAATYAGTNSYFRMATQNIVLPKMGGGSIKGTVYQKPQSNNAALVPVASKTLSLDFWTTGASGALGTAVPYLYYPTYDTTAKAVTYSRWLTTTTDANGVFTFSGLPFKTYTETVYVDIGAGAQTSDGAIQAASFSLSDLVSGNLAVGVNGAASAVTVTDPYKATVNAIYNNLAFVSTSTTDSNGRTNQVAVTSPIVLTFNNTLVNNVSYGTDNKIVQTATGNLVAGSVAVSGTTLTFTPAASLAFNTGYTVSYKVTDGKKTISNSFTFTTLPDSTALVAVSDLALNSLKTSYNSGSSSFQVTFTYNKNYIYTLYYKTKDSATEWTNGSTVTLDAFSGTTGYATLTLGGTDSLVSGNTVSLKLRQTSSTTGNAFVESNVLAVKDTVAPTSLTFKAMNLGEGAMLNNSTGTAAYNVVFTLTLGSSEVQSLPTAAFVTTVTDGSTVTTSLSPDSKTAYVSVTVPKGKDQSANTLKITPYDGAGNQYVGSGTTATTFTTNALGTY